MKLLPSLLLILLLVFPFCLEAQTPAAAPSPKDPLQDSVIKYSKTLQYARAVPFAEQYVSKVKSTLGETHKEYGTALDDLGFVLGRSNRLAEAEKTLLLALDVRRKALGENHAVVANTCQNVAIIYSIMGQYKTAERYYHEGLTIRRLVLGNSHPDVATSLGSLGMINRQFGNYPLAEKYLLEALAIRKKAQGETHMDVSQVMINLGVLYKDMGYYEKSEDCYLRSLVIRKKELGENHPNIGNLYNNLGGLYLDLGDFKKAETALLAALAIRRKVFGENHRDVAGTLSNLGTLHGDLGNYYRQESYALQALQIQQKVLGDDHPDIGQYYDNLGVIYMNLLNHPKAETYLLKGLALRRKSLPPDHPEISQSIHNLGNLYSNTGSFQKAEKLMLEALEMRKKKLDPRHPDIGNSLFRLGVMHMATGNWKQSAQYHSEALAIRRQIGGEINPELGVSLHELGILNLSSHQPAQAEGFFLDWAHKKQIEIQRYFPFMSDFEKEKYVQNKVAQRQGLFNAFCVERVAGNKSLTAEWYNDQLATKGLLLSSATKWKHRIRTSGDSGLTTLFFDWEANRNNLNRLYQSTDSTERAGIDSLEQKTEKIEKELSVRSEAFARMSERKLVTWKQVQKALKPGEAAVEMIRIAKFGSKGYVTDTTDIQKTRYQRKGLTDTIYYVGLVVKPGSAYPEMVLLKNGNDLEGKYLKFYQNAIKNKVSDLQSYQQFWQKLGEKLGGFHKIYFSPDGVFHQINLNTLQNPKTKKALLDEKEIQYITSTKDLAFLKDADNNHKLAYLFGFPNFEAPFEQNDHLVASREIKRSPEMNYTLQLNSGQISLTSLPGTKVEIERISELLNRHQWEVHALMRDKALEETLKESNRPRLLHIATHGYFQNDSSGGYHPLLRSGLFLSRAGNSLKGTQVPGSDDGILTAYEAMNLNLDNTDLVVLSACETGLGEIKNGEGVYGLQRAFTVAGAKTIIMSLWKVDDRATQELMVSFYNHWLGGKKMSKRSAFHAAQKDLKTKYQDPYYWGAFVMVGE